MSKRRKIFFGALKYLLAFAALAFVLQQVDMTVVKQYLTTMEWWYLALALLVLNIAQYFSALRLQHYIQHAGIVLRKGFVVRLHYVGLFFNFLLPGGIGGDAFKGLVIKRGSELKLKRVLQLLLSDRANGFYVLNLLMLFSALFIQWQWSLTIVAIGVAGLSLLLTAAYYFSTRFLLAENAVITTAAMPYSFGVQLCTLLAVGVIWQALGNDSHLAAYIFLFQIASVVGVLPVSVGGIGLRELTFFYGAHYLDVFAGVSLTAEFGVALALLFNLTLLVSALFGILFLGKINPSAFKEHANGSTHHT